MDFFASLTYIYMLGLGCGIWSKKEIIDWCDKVIEVKEDPPYEIIELSLMSNAKIDDIEGKLLDLSKVTEDNYSVKILLGVLYKKINRKQMQMEQAIKCSTRLLVRTGLYNEKEYYNLYGIDDSFDLAKAGVYGDLTDAEDSYLDEIRVFSKYFDEFHQKYHTEMNNEWDC